MRGGSGCDCLNGVARIYGGLHDRNTIEVSWTQGEAIAQNIIDNFYVHEPNDDWAA